MITDKKEIEVSALNLDKEDKARLADKLWLSIHGEIDYEIEQAWMKEIERRKKELISGKTKAIPAEEVHRKIRENLRKK